MLEVRGHLYLLLCMNSGRSQYTGFEVSMQQGGSILIRPYPYEKGRELKIEKDDELPHLIAGVLIGTTPLFLLADRFRELGFESVADVIGNCAKKQQMA